MKALVVVNLAGFLTFLWNDIDTLQKMGYTVEVAMNGTMADGSDAIEISRLKSKGIKYHKIDFNTKKPISKNNLVAYKQIKEVLKGNYDAVHCHTPIVGIITRIAANKYRKKGAKVIYTTHGFTFTERSSRKTWALFYSIEKFASYFCDAIITINHEDFENAKKMCCPNVFIISSVGIDNKRFENVKVDKEAHRMQFGVTPNDKMILAVGELSNRKNHQVIIHAIGMLPDKEKYVFVIYGRAVTNSNLPDELKAYAEKMNVRLVLAGHRLDIPEANKCADVAVIPSLREGMGMAGLEALASGVPVVGSDVQGIREYIVNGETGYLCNPDEPREFAIAIEKLANFPEQEKKAMAERCKQMAYNFDIDVSKKQMKQIYETILVNNR